MLIYSIPFPCCPSCEIQADDAIPPREKERRGRKKKKKRKEEKIIIKKRQQAGKKLFHSIAYCWHVQSYVRRSWRDCRSSPVHRTAGGTGNRVFQTPPAPGGSKPTPATLPPAFSPGRKSIRNRLTILKTKQSCHHHMCLLKPESKPTLVIPPN